MPLRQREIGLGVAVFAVLLLALLEYRLVVMLHSGHLERITSAAHAVTIGEPHWRVYQNRLLGPFAVAFLSRSIREGVAFAPIFLLVVFLLTVVKQYVGFVCLASWTGSHRRALLLTAVATAAFVALQDQVWLYLWDYLDVIAFTLFAYGALSRRGNLFFALLFGAALLNKESALFIPLWLVLDGCLEQKRVGAVLPSFALRDPLRVALGAVLLLGGLLFVESVREALYVGDTALEAGRNFHWRFQSNVAQFATNLHNPTILMNVLVDVLIVAAPLALVRIRARLNDATLKVALVFLAVYASTLLFGSINEMRVFLAWIPFAVFLGACPAAPLGEDDGIA